MCVGRGMCVIVCMWVFRGQHWVSSALYKPCFNGLTLNLEFTDSTRLASQWAASIIHLSAFLVLELQTRDTELNFLHGHWGCRRRSLRLCVLGQALYSPCHYLNPVSSLLFGAECFCYWMVGTVTAQSSLALEPCLCCPPQPSIDLKSDLCTALLWSTRMNFKRMVL